MEVHLTLIANWKAVLAKAWSVKFAILAGLLSGLEAAMPFIREAIEPLGLVPPGGFAILAAMASAAALVARVIVQQDIPGSAQNGTGNS